MFNIILVEGSKEFDRKFYIDCPVDGSVKAIGFPCKSDEIIRMQIPPALAKYISNLQQENRGMKLKLK